MKLAVVVQRYGTQINGGAELHARYIVELLARQHQVEVITTCARDYVTWRDEWPEGTESVRGVPVRRFRVSRERDPEDFGRRQTHVFERPHSVADELAWLESEGPTCPALVEHLRTHAQDYDYIIFFSYRYYHAYHGARAVPGKAILVPTAERDSTIGLSIFGPIFRGVRAIMYNSPEERAMIQAATGNTQVPGVVVGVGSDVHRSPMPGRFRRKYRIDDPFIIYVGRIDENKGCRELFAHFTSYRPRLGQRLKLVLIGNSILPIPEHPNVHHLGFVSDQDKFDAMAAADALVMPSYYESLSMVALEAWALGKPVLANGRCDVLRGQCIRSRAGLYYETFEEFAETLFTLTTNHELAEALGDNGRQYFEQHYAWPVIERKYLGMLEQLAREDAAGRAAKPVEPLPGWLTRRRKVLSPASEVLTTLPKGAALGADALGAMMLSASVGAASSSTVSPSTSLSSSLSGSSSASSSIGGGETAGGGRDSRGDRRRDPRHRREGRDGRDGRDSRDGRDRDRDRRHTGRRDGERREREGRDGERERTDADGNRERRDTERREGSGDRDAPRREGQRREGRGRDGQRREGSRREGGRDRPSSDRSGGVRDGGARDAGEGRSRDAAGRESGEGRSRDAGREGSEGRSREAGGRESSEGRTRDAGGREGSGREGREGGRERSASGRPPGRDGQRRRRSGRSRSGGSGSGSGGGSGSSSGGGSGGGSGSSSGGGSGGGAGSGSGGGQQ